MPYSPVMTETSAADLARRLLRAAEKASLATLLDGAPYASLVLLAVDHDASPILLLSTLAEHTRNLAADGRVALLLDGTAGLDEPLTGPRLTVLGQASVSDEPRLRQRFLARHPGAALYAGFKDFAFRRVTVERGHLVAGFGRITWLAGSALLGRLEPGLAEREADIVAHMNADHADAVRLYATRLAGLPDGTWQMTGCDPEGIDLRLGGRVGRVDFARPVADAGAARSELVRLAQLARTKVANSVPSA
jgi:putative heme iron utilization protein